MLCNHSNASTVYGINPLFLEGLHIFFTKKNLGTMTIKSLSQQPSTFSEKTNTFFSTKTKQLHLWYFLAPRLRINLKSCCLSRNIFLKISTLNNSSMRSTPFRHLKCHIFYEWSVINTWGFFLNFFTPGLRI